MSRIVPDFIRRSYARKFALVLLIIAGIILAIGLIGTSTFVGQAEETVNKEFRTLAETQAISTERWVGRSEEVTRLLSASETIRDEESARVIADFLQGKKGDLFSGIHEMHVVHLVSDSNQEVVGSTAGSVAPGSDFSESGREWIESTTPPDQVSGVVVTEPYEVEGTAVVGFMSKVSGEEEHVLVMEVRASSLANRFNTQGRAEGGYTAVVSTETGRIVADERGETTLGSYPDSEILSAAAELGRNFEPSKVTSKSGIEGIIDERYIAGYAPVQKRDVGADWAVVTHVPEASVLGTVRSVETFGLVATLVGALSVVLVGAVVGYSTTRSIRSLTDKVNRIEDGDLDVEVDSHRIDSLGELYDGVDGMRLSLADRIREAEAARQEAEELADHLQEKAQEYGAVMRECADGDLSKRLDEDSDNEAMEAIAVEFNGMIDELEATIDEVKRFAIQVATSSEEVTSGTEEVRSASQRVTDSIQEISDGTDRQNRKFNTVTQEMNELSTTTEEIAASSNQVADLAERTAEEGREGREAAEEAKLGVDEIRTESQQAVEEIQQLTDEMEEIDRTLEFIGNVAEQTNMLALNANIEASRAGTGEGDEEGFGVVAEEIKELANETVDAAENIEARLERIQQQTDRAADRVQRTGDRIDEHSEAIQNAIESLDEIADQAEETNTGIQEIRTATQDQASTTEEVVALVSEASEISERTSQEAESVAAAAEEQTSALSEVTDNVGELATESNRLADLLERFDTETEIDGFADAGFEQSSVEGTGTPETPEDDD